jgi:hypothetical protein
MVRIKGKSRRKEGLSRPFLGGIPLHGNSLESEGKDFNPDFLAHTGWIRTSVTG